VREKFHDISIPNAADSGHLDPRGLARSGMTAASPPIMPTLFLFAIVALVVAGLAGFIWLLRRTGNL